MSFINKNPLQFLLKFHGKLSCHKYNHKNISFFPIFTKLSIEGGHLANSTEQKIVILKR